MSQSGYNGYKGILLEQNKEPLLSRGIRQLEKLPVEERFFLDSRVDASNMTPERLVIAARQAQIVDECGTQSHFLRILCQYPVSQLPNRYLHVKMPCVYKTNGISKAWTTIKS